MSRLKDLIRQNRREKEIGNCIKQLSKLLNVEVEKDDFLYIEETDLLTDKFYNSFKSSEHKLGMKCLSSEVEKLEEYIENIRIKFTDRGGYLITKQTEECGLLKVSIEKVLEKYKEVIKLDGDSLCILTTDEREGIYIDYFEENNNDFSLWYYELCFWKI